MQPGRPTAALKPLFPAEMTVAISCARSASIATLRPWLSPSQFAVNIPAPRLMFTETMSEASVPSSASTRSRASTWSDGNELTHGAGFGLQSAAALKRVKTLIAMMSASGATPSPGAPVTPVASPAAIPATCEPWSQMLAVPSMHAAISTFADPAAVSAVPPPAQMLTPPPAPPAFE
jgi:hypothetical protein